MTSPRWIVGLATRPAAAGFLLLLTFRNAGAQAVDVTLRENPTRAPVAGAILRLVSPQGTAAQGLTNEQGRVVLRAPSPGTYRLRADRIGFNGQFTAPFDLAAGQTLRTELVLDFERRILPTLTVSGRSKCEAGSRGGDLAAALWEEIRTALTANVITMGLAAQPLHVREFQRELTKSGQPVRQWVFSSVITRRAPFVSLPPFQLARRGFVEEIGDTVSFAAPDAPLLLSDEFVGTHCFKAVTGSQGEVGLAFSPIAGRKVPEVTGTLWVDRATSELQFLEYRYTGLSTDLDKADLGGRVEFRKLGGGGWIVSNWYIRMPKVEGGEVRGVGNTRQNVTRLIGYLDRGGRVELATDTTMRIALALVTGQIYDSTTSSGLNGAIVRIEGIADSVVTGSDGRFAIAVTASGPRNVVASHPKLSLGGPASTPAVLSLGDSTMVRFAVPSLATLARELCGSARDQSGVLGLAWRADGSLIGSPTAVVTWATGAGGVREDRNRNGRGGLYGFCDLPPNQTLTVRLRADLRTLTERRVRLAPARYSWLDLREWGSADTSSTAPRIAGPAVLVGTVRNDSTGRPLAGAEVLIEGNSTPAVTDDSGSYALGDLRPGRRVALFRSIGYRPVRQWVQLTPGDTVWADAGLVPTVRQLDPVEVKAAVPGPRGMGREAFEERRKMGFGWAIDSAEMRRSEGFKLLDLLSRRGDIGFMRLAGRGAAAISRRKTGPMGEPCYMQVYVDGAIMWRSTAPGSGDMREPFDIKQFEVTNLESMEVYRSAAETPIEFGGSGAACGTIVLWTRRGP